MRKVKSLRFARDFKGTLKCVPYFFLCFWNVY